MLARLDGPSTPATATDFPFCSIALRLKISAIRTDSRFGTALVRCPCEPANRLDPSRDRHTPVPGAMLMAASSSTSDARNPGDFNSQDADVLAYRPSAGE